VELKIFTELFAAVLEAKKGLMLFSGDYRASF
jgi:hypothetical protein